MGNGTAATGTCAVELLQAGGRAGRQAGGWVDGLAGGQVGDRGQEAGDGWQGERQQLMHLPQNQVCLCISALLVGFMTHGVVQTGRRAGKLAGVRTGAHRPVPRHRASKQRQAAGTV